MMQEHMPTYPCPGCHRTFDTLPALFVHRREYHGWHTTVASAVEALLVEIEALSVRVKRLEEEAELSRRP